MPNQLDSLKALGIEIWLLRKNQDSQAKFKLLNELSEQPYLIVLSQALILEKAGPLLHNILFALKLKQEDCCFVVPDQSGLSFREIASKLPLQKVISFGIHLDQQSLSCYQMHDLLEVLSQPLLKRQLMEALFARV